MSARPLTGEVVRKALGKIGERLADKQLRGEICILGGAAMMLAFQARQTTKDVDAIFAPASIIRQIARQVAEEEGLPEHWLNDGVKGFVSARMTTDPSLDEESDSLRITYPTAEYLLAMKCLASRMSYGSEEHTDSEDIKFLIKRIGYKSKQDVLANVEKYYKRELILPKTQFLVEAIMNDILHEHPRQ